MDYLTRLLNPENAGVNYIEDLSSAYYLSEALFTAKKLGLFEAMGRESKNVAEIASTIDCDPRALSRLLALLKEMRLVASWPEKPAEDPAETSWYLTSLAQETLLEDADASQTSNVAWRADLRDDWASLPEAIKAGRRTHFLADPTPEEMEERRKRYLTAMDDVLDPKVTEILPILEGFFDFRNSDDTLRILDLGAGSGLFSLRLLERLNETGQAASAELFDIPEMAEICEASLKERDEDLMEKITISSGNLLEPGWPLTQERYDLIVLSNIVHAYDEETREVLKQAASLLSPDGLILVHDFFLEHDALKSRMSDLNMFVNTYNGRAFTAREVGKILKDCALNVSRLVPLSGDTAVLFAGSTEALETLRPDTAAQLIPKILDLGFERVLPIDPKEIVIGSFARAKCHFGCRSGGTKTCRENDQESLEALTERLSSYNRAYLLLGEPPTDTFQRQALLAEAEAFKSGFHKAFVFWAGPCSICPNCDPEKPCQNPAHHRPSMEGSGIDVFETAKTAGVELRTLREKGEFIRYLALLLLD